jgi:dienelactone hydrolase
MARKPARTSARRTARAAFTPPVPVVEHGTAPVVRRFVEQRWLLDNVIQANGIDWDQPRTTYLNAPLGLMASGDFAAIRLRVKKFADCAPAFQAAARRREAIARAALDAGELVAARENYMVAAVHWGAAQWPYDENNAENLHCNQRKRECYAHYAKLAAHPVEEVWIPFNDTALPGWLHLPPGAKGKVPVVVTIPGMDSFKEISVSMYGDRWLSRGIAVLAIDGPGQYESAVLGIPVTVENWQATGPAVMAWLSRRREIDMDRVGLSGNSFGTLFSTLMASAERRFKAVAISAPCLEPSCETLFQQASPTFKQRFMYMARISDEDEFDDFRRDLTWEGHAEKIRAPYLCITGESDELAPLPHTERMFQALRGPRRLVIYQDARHGLGLVPSTSLGPSAPTLIADWMAARLAGKPFKTERWFVDAGGNVKKTPL